MSSEATTETATVRGQLDLVYDVVSVATFLFGLAMLGMGLHTPIVTAIILVGAGIVGVISVVWLLVGDAQR